MKFTKYILSFLFLTSIQPTFSQTYVLDARGVKLASIEGCKKKSNGIPCDSCFIITGADGKLSRCLHISEIRTLVGSIVEGSDCPCCALESFDSDTAAYYQGRVKKDEYYLTSAGHMEGLGYGIYKQVPENYGWKLWTVDSISYGFGGLIVMSKNTTRVGFSATFLPPCRLEAPDVDLLYFESDEAAITGGLSVGNSYLLTQNNLYGLPKNWIKKID
jgi:hypothetical protein